MTPRDLAAVPRDMLSRWRRLQLNPGDAPPPRAPHLPRSSRLEKPGFVEYSINYIRDALGAEDIYSLLTDDGVWEEFATRAHFSRYLPRLSDSVRRGE